MTAEQLALDYDPDPDQTDDWEPSDRTPTPLRPPTGRTPRPPRPTRHPPSPLDRPHHPHRELPVTTSLRYAHTTTAAAVLATAGAAWLATAGHWIPAAGLAYTVAFFAWLAAREYANHRRVLLEHEWARRHALGQNPPPLTPCCRLGHATRGAAHDHRCTDLTTRQHTDRPESAA